jgi:hypothetical protein
MKELVFSVLVADVFIYADFTSVVVPSAGVGGINEIENAPGAKVVVVVDVVVVVVVDDVVVVVVVAGGRVVVVAGASVVVVTHSILSTLIP